MKNKPTRSRAFSYSLTPFAFDIKMAAKFMTDLDIMASGRVDRDLQVTSVPMGAPMAGDF
jgi:hypothetical protein